MTDYRNREAHAEMFSDIDLIDPPDSRAQAAYKPLKLTPEEFEKALIPELRDMHEIMKPIFSIRVYELAQQKVQMEEARERYRLQPETIRRSMRRCEEILTQIRRASCAVNIATHKLSGDEIEIRAQLRLSHAQRLLIAAAEDFTRILTVALPRQIHPKLRKGREREASQGSEQFADKSIPSLGYAAVDHWFLGEVDRLFASFRTGAVMQTRAGRDRIIQSIFQIAFSTKWEIERIKTARLRMKKKHPQHSR